MRRPGSSIRNRIVRATVAVGLVPLAVVGAVVVVSLQRLSADAGRSVDESRAALSTQVVTAGLEGSARNVADDIDTYLLERVRDARMWASDPLVRSAALSGGQEAERLGLKSKSVDELENRFRDTPSIGSSPQAAAYLAAEVTESGAFAEMFFTDANGYNVAYSAKTSDFVQSDEDWWRAAWAKGLDVGAIDYDESARVFSSEISVRIDGADGARLGVLKAVLNLGVVQRIADSQSQSRNVTVLDEKGLVLAETATRHEPTRIMNPAVVYGATVDQAIARSLDVARSAGNASVITDERAVGAAMTGRTQEPVAGFTGFAWTVLVDQPTEAAFAPLSSVGQVRESIATASTALTVLVILVVLLVGLGAFAVAVPLARRIVRPILHLRDAADDIATTRLPELVASIDLLRAGEELPVLAPIEVRTGDEVEQLADKFNSVISTAGRLAAEQVESRRQNLSTTFVSMGRRNQKLLGRQLRVLDDLERHESDPDSLEGLFKLDQLATRMRRNAESLLVLAGHEATRTWSRTVSIQDVVRSAVSEIEDYARVDLSSVEPAWVRGNAVAEVAHLLAELCENATMFSPPDTQVEVIGRARDGGYRISIVDRGIGMTEAQIAEANHKLQHPDAFDQVPSQYLGHFVVGRLAARMGVEVRLFESATDGLVARVSLPGSLLESGPGEAEPETPPPAEPGVEAEIEARSTPIPNGLGRPSGGEQESPAPEPEQGAGGATRPQPAAGSRGTGPSTGTFARRPSWWEAPVEPPPAADAPRPGVPSTGAGPPGQAVRPVPGGPGAAGGPLAARDRSGGAGGTGTGPPLPERTRRPGGPPTPGAEPGVEITASGFRVRQRKGPAISPPTQPKPAPIPAPAPPPARSADEARRTLSTFMTGVDQGRRDVNQATTDDPPAREHEHE